jgi:hypothetical protein
MWNDSPRKTLDYVVRAAAAAESLRARCPDRLVFCVGSELTLFMRGILPGKTLNQRLTHAFSREGVKTGRYVEPLGVFLADANTAVREVFHGPVTYAALVWETVDWSLFDFVGVDHYRDGRIKDRYLERLQPLFDHGKPVVVTEFGMRTYQGAESSGTLGFGAIDHRSQFLHRNPSARSIRTPPTTSTCPRSAWSRPTPTDTGRPTRT